MTRLFIENKELDLTADLSQQITYAIDDIRNIDSKATTFSRTIILPGTANNNNLFGQIFEFNHANFVNDVAPNVEYNFNAAKSAQCRLLADSVQVLKGSLRLLQIVVDGSRIEYEICIFGELGGFITKLGALKLQDLDFSDYDHEFNETNVENSWDDANAGAGYYYPHIDYGNYNAGSDKKDWNIGTFRPALFVKEYLEKIVANAGYTMDFPLKETDRFKRLIIPYNRKILTAQNTLILDRGSTENTITGISSEDAEFNGGTGSLGAFTTSDDKTFTYGGSTTVSVIISFELNIEYLSYPLTLRIVKNGSPIENFVFSGDGYYTFDSLDFSINPSDTLRFNFDNLDVSETLLYLIGIKVNTETAIPTPVLYGDNVTMNDIIPQNILQKDFFISIIKLFNLYVDEDTNVEKKLVIKPFVDYYVDVTDDYSDRVDRSQPMVIKPMSELNSRYYQFKYKSDSDYWNELYRKRYNEGYGDRIFDSEYEFASETQTSELIFAATPIVGYAEEDKKFSTIFKRNGNEPNVTEEQVDSVIRILQAKKITEIASWRLFEADDTGVLGDFTKYGYAGHFDDPDDPATDLNFGATKELFFPGNATSVNQFNVYYSPYMAEITDKDSRLLTCSIKFNQLQIHNLDFSRYIWIDGGLYRLMRIIDYTPGTTDVCKVELLRVINKTYAPEEYSSVTICSQVWMDKNWDGTTFRNGDTIPEVTDQSTWEALTTPAWCYYDNDAANGAIYGKLYNWYAVSDSRGLAPVGWRVPTTNDFQTLVDCLGGIDGNGGKLKETGTTHWNAPNTGATNDSGWTGLGGGLRIENNFSDLKDTGIWWSQTAFDSINAYNTFLQSTNADVNLNNQFPKFYGLSVRLIKDI